MIATFYFYSQPFSKDPSRYFLSLDELFAHSTRMGHQIANLWTGSFDRPIPADYPNPF